MGGQNITARSCYLGEQMLTPYIEIGEVLRPHGIQGLVKVRPETDTPERFLALKEIWLAQGANYRSAAVQEISVRDDGFVYLRLDGAATRNDAEKQRGLILYVDRANARKLDKDEWFICDLIGCQVSTDSGESVGEVIDVMQPGPNDVFVIRTPKGEALVPVLKRVIVSVDVENRRIVLNHERLPEVAVFD